MSFDITHSTFLDQAKISHEDWDRSGMDWENLVSIASSYIKLQPTLISTAEQISSRIRTFEGVHSVRWRIKDTLHLLKKIVRKNLEEKPQEKWIRIDSNNYLSCATDLIGVRALHLFKDECIIIDESIRTTWNICEPVTIYIRDGESTHSELLERGGELKVHAFGYRSIHYIIKSQPEKIQLTTEIQVRTIFQEGWSEIDHRVKYPDYSDNPEIKLFLQVFNGLAGSADEMGSFVKNLTKFLSDSEQITSNAFSERQAAFEERDQAIAQIASYIEELKELRIKDRDSQALITNMQASMNKLIESQKRTAIQTLAEKHSTISTRAKQSSEITIRSHELSSPWEIESFSKSLDILGKALSNGTVIGRYQKKHND